MQVIWKCITQWAVIPYKKCNVLWIFQMKTIPRVPWEVNSCFCFCLKTLGVLCFFQNLSKKAKNKHTLGIYCFYFHPEMSPLQKWATFSLKTVQPWWGLNEENSDPRKTIFPNKLKLGLGLFCDWKSLFWEVIFFRWSYWQKLPPPTGQQFSNTHKPISMQLGNEEKQKITISVSRLFSSQLLFFEKNKICDRRGVVWDQKILIRVRESDRGRLSILL